GRLGRLRVKGKKRRKPLLPACVPKPVRITRRAHSWTSPPSRSRTAILTIAAGEGAEGVVFAGRRPRRAAGRRRSSARQAGGRRRCGARLHRVICRPPVRRLL